MTGKVTPAIGYIGNALRSIAKDHITGFTEDTYDEHFQEYQAILNKLNAIQDEEGNLKKTPFKYIVNEEFIFAMVDENDVFLAGLQWDGTPKFAKMEENAGHEISSINAQIKYLHEEINQVRTDLAENIEIKDEEGAVVKTPFRYIQNEEFIFAKVDAEDKFLFGIEWDGTPKFGKTSAVEDRLQSQVTLISEKVATIMGDEDTTNIIDTMNELKKFFAEIKNTETLTDILANLDNVAKNLDKTTIKDEEGNVQDTPFRVISNEEFIKAIVDAENKVLFGFYRATGEPYYPLNEMYHVIQNEEYFAAWITTDDKVVLGLRRDGEIIGEIHAVNALKQVISELKEKLDTIYDNTKELLSVLSLQENQEYLTVEKDADDKVLSATYNDGSHYIHKAKSETIPEEFEHIEDPEGRTEITTDADRKVMSYRDSSGKKHEYAMEVTNLDVSNLNLQGNSVNNIQDALKANGFDVKTPVDWSESSFIQIPEPRFAIINVSNIDSMPTTKTDNKKAFLEFWDMQGNYFKKHTILNAQGNSSLAFIKKNVAIDLCDDEWIGDDTPKVRIGKWVPQDSFHMKAYYTDFFRGAG